MRFGSRAASEDVMFPVRSPRIRPRIELTERVWENGVEGIGRENVYICSFEQLFNSKNKVVGYSYPHARFTRRKKKGRGGGGREWGRERDREFS